MAKLDKLDNRIIVADQVERPYGNNQVKPLGTLFNDRAYYQDFIIPHISGYLPDSVVFGDLTGKNSLYGLINKDLNVVLPSSNYMQALPSGDDKKYYAMDFVVEAFNQMNAYLSTGVISGKLTKDSPFFNLKAYNGYTDPNASIEANQIKAITEFKKKVINSLELSSKIKDVASFNKNFLLLLKDLIKNHHPISKSATVLRNNFKSFSSGLIIDVAKDKADNDQIKFDKYLSKNDFLVFAEACKRFGFLIDKNVPWRIMADVNSPAMIESTGNHNGYMRRYNISDVNDLFSKRYFPILFDELFHLKNFFFNAYNSLVRDYPYYEIDYKKLSGCDFNNQTIFKRETLTRQQYFNNFPDTYWMRVFVYIRNYEESKNFSQTQFDNIVREANNFVSAKKTEQALLYINSFFKDFNQVQYFSSLQNTNQTVEQIAQSVIKTELIF